MNIFFIIVCLFHHIIWIFVLLAFVNKTLAKINVYIIIPLIYLIHILPFHILVSLKCKLYSNNKSKVDKDLEKINKLLIFPYLFDKLVKKLEKYSFRSPISVQGMLLFGMITSIYRLHPPNLKKLFK